MPIDVNTFEGYTITVEGGSSQFLGTGSDTEVETPNWELGALSIDNRGGSATVFYQRDGINQKPKVYRKSVVTIKKGETPILYGEVVEQSNTHERITLDVESFSMRLDDLSIYGVIMKNDASGPLPDNTTTQAFPVFNEKSLPDMMEGLDGFYANDNREPYDEEYYPNTWSMMKIAIQCFSMIQYWQTGIFVYDTYFDFDGAIEAMEAAEVTFGPKYGVSPRSGLLSVIEQAAQENGGKAVWYLDAAELKYKLKFEIGATIKTLAMADTGKADELEKVPFSVNVNYDFNSPTILGMYSGRSYIQTCLEFSTSSAELETEKDETGTEATGREYIVIRSNGTREENSTVGSLQVADLPPSTKVLTQTAISPHIINLNDDDFDNTEIKFASDFDLYVKFFSNFNSKPTFDTSFTEGAGHLLVGSELWQKAETKGSEQTIQLFEKFDIEVKTDGFEVRIYAPINKDANEMGGDGNVTLENFKLLVDEIVIPVAIEVPHRILALATKDDSVNLAVSTEMRNGWDHTTGTVDTLQEMTADPAEEVLQTAVVNEIRPVYQIKDIQTYNESTGEITKRTTGAFPNQSALETTMQEKAAEELQTRILDDSTSVTINMPIECYFDLPASYPKAVGDAVDEIGGEAAHGITRRVQVTDISLSNERATINLS